MEVDSWSHTLHSDTFTKGNENYKQYYFLLNETDK